MRSSTQIGLKGSVLEHKEEKEGKDHPLSFPILTVALREEVDNGIQRLVTMLVGFK